MLKFNGKRPINFGGVDYNWSVNQETQLRLETARFDTEQETKEADEVLASCFSDEKAKKFIKENLSALDKQLIISYMIGGETGVNVFDKGIDKSLEKNIIR